MHTAVNIDGAKQKLPATFYMAGFVPYCSALFNNIPQHSSKGKEVKGRESTTVNRNGKYGK